MVKASFYYIDDSIIDINKCGINNCWTKLCLFLEVRWSRYLSIWKWRRVSIPAGKVVLSRAKFRKVSVQVSVSRNDTIPSERRMIKSRNKLPYFRHRIGKVTNRQRSLKVNFFLAIFLLSWFLFRPTISFFLISVILSFLAKVINRHEHFNLTLGHGHAPLGRVAPLGNELMNMFLLCSTNFNLKRYFFPYIPHKRLQAEHSSTRYAGLMHK